MRSGGNKIKFAEKRLIRFLPDRARRNEATASLNTKQKAMKLTDIQKERLVKAIKYLALAIATAVAMALGLTSCNVTRTITTESKSLTRGDTAVIIQSKTIESYNARKN
jgi:hypothetical protein